MKNKKCKNCNHSINGIFCSKCGQKNIELLKFKDLIKDFLDHLLDLDFRLFITLKYLITRPGYLTTEYWRGRRKRYIPPFKIYLITSFLYFFSYSVLPHAIMENSEADDAIIETKNIETNVLVHFDDIPEKFDYYIDKYEKESELLLLLPLTAFGLLLLNKKHKHLFYSHHFIASLHLSSAWFILQTFTEIFKVFLPNHSSVIEFFNISLLVYCAIAIKNIYKCSFVWAIIKTISLMTISLVVFVLIVFSFILMIIVI